MAAAPTLWRMEVSILASAPDLAPAAAATTEALAEAEAASLEAEFEVALEKAAKEAEEEATVGEAEAEEAEAEEAEAGGMADEDELAEAEPLLETSEMPEIISEVPVFAFLYLWKIIELSEDHEGIEERHSSPVLAPDIRDVGRLPSLGLDLRPRRNKGINSAIIENMLEGDEAGTLRSVDEAVQAF